MEDKNINILIDENQIREKVKEIGKIITNDYADKNLYVLSLLRGSFIFAADLVRAIDLNVKIGFMTTSSYGASEVTTGKVKVVNDLQDNIEGYDVLVVDDIIDTGITMNFVVDYLKSKGAKTVNTCVLLDKPERRKTVMDATYKCFTIPDVFVVGYGLNYGDYYRNVPYIFNWEK